MNAPAPLVRAHARLKAWLLEDAYPLWASVGRNPTGGWMNAIRMKSTGPDPDTFPVRCRVQARQTFAYAVAPQLGWSGDWRGAMGHGLAFLADRLRCGNGLYRTAISSFGPDHLHDQFRLYDQAFVLFALAHAWAAGDAGALAAAEDLLAHLPPHPLGGFREVDIDGQLDANSNMHLFEAFLAWSLAGGGSVWGALADRQAELCVGRLIEPQTGAVIEFFDGGWNMPAPADRDIDPGHQFEWAWLLMRWSQIAGRGQDLRTALGLIEVGERIGVDPVRKAVIATLTGELAVRDDKARLWPQTERLKANALAASITGDPACWAAAEEAAQTLLRYLDTPVRGLWRDVLRPNGAFRDEPAPASSFYHIIMAILELDRLLARG